MSNTNNTPGWTPPHIHIQPVDAELTPHSEDLVAQLNTMPQLCELARVWVATNGDRNRNTDTNTNRDKNRESKAEKVVWTLRMSHGLPELQNPEGQRWTIDFRTGKSSHRARQSRQSLEPMARALGLAKLPTEKRALWHIVDGTAGAGADGWQLAASGASVTMVEQHPVLFTQLKSAIDAARSADVDDSGAAASAAASAGAGASVALRINVINDSVERFLERASTAAGESRPSIATREEHRKSQVLVRPIDAIYLDPMYPVRRSKAAVKKPMQFIQGLVGKGPDALSVLSHCLNALQHSPINRVVVKRPSDAPPLLGADDWSGQYVTVNAGAARFDVYLTP